MPKVFLSYASEDRELVQKLSERLRADGFDVWRDSEQLVPGDDWEREILQALNASEFVVACFSKQAVEKRGYVQKEWRRILDAADLIPLVRNFIVPARLDDCALPLRFQHLHRADYFASDGYGLLCKALRTPQTLRGREHRTAISNVPRATRHFFGREDLLGEVFEALRTKGTAAVTALSGMGGIGKTQLALRYAEEQAADYSIRWYVDAETAPDAGLLALGAELPELREAGTEITVASVLKWLRSNEGWLLIFDNAESEEALSPYLPEGAGHILITSRNANWDNLAQPLAIDKWSQPESIEFLAERTGDKDRQAAARIATELDGLPLALEQAAAYVKATQCGLAGYAALLEKQAPVLLAKYGPIAYKNTAAGALALSFDRVATVSPAALDLLSLFAFLAPDDIPELLLDEGSQFLPQPLREAVDDPLRRDEAVAILRTFSLVERAKGGYWVHRVAQTLVRARLGDAAKDWAQVAAELVNQNWGYDHNDMASWPRTFRLESHAAAALHHANGLGVAADHRVWLAGTLGFLANVRGSLAFSRSLREYAVEVSMGVFGKEHRETLASMCNLAETMRAQGDLDGVRKMQEEVLSIQNRVLGAEHPDTLKSMNNLAGTRQAQGDLGGARKMQEEVLALCRRLLGAEHPGTLISMGNLAATMRAQGDLVGAQKMFKEVLAIHRCVLGAEHPDTTVTAWWLANTLIGLNQIEDAKRIAQDLLEWLVSAADGKLSSNQRKARDWAKRTFGW